MELKMAITILLFVITLPPTLFGSNDTTEFNYQRIDSNNVDIKYSENASVGNDAIAVTTNQANRDLYSSIECCVLQADAPLDGMAFFLASNGWDIPKSSGGGWLGLVSNQHPNSSSHDYPFVAVEFDTFSNDWDPKTGTDVTNSAQNPPTSSLPGASSNSPPTSSAPGTSRKSKTWIWAITGLGSFAFLGVIIVIFPFRRHRQLGEGGFGKVHEGYLSKLKTKVAIKKVTPNSTQGMKEYVAEVKAVSQLRHRSLVQLVGWRHRKKELLLIYEFMSNGSLDTHLFKGKSLLTWEILYKIAQDMASSLLYLHEEWAQCVVHRDIKCSNIMLDSSFNAKLGDLGLARIDDHGKGSQTTVLAGTMGYMAPECLYTGKASKESDVYSFCVSHWR
ncbi:hypothetical protein CRG98_046386 [Punica granatum]|uniref:non-specific serine/threonine protein kinase n=1 Tax=Punica granatum TaxID=22663 RepID=A0A2I0HNA0_PUNGR|nr:hypothetical protein CRG98_046386 [Punica granatum]